MIMVWQNWRTLDAQAVRTACSLALVSAGIRIEISTAMMPMTTRSSTRVKPLRADGRRTTPGGFEWDMYMLRIGRLNVAGRTETTWSRRLRQSYDFGEEWIGNPTHF